MHRVKRYVPSRAAPVLVALFVLALAACASTSSEGGPDETVAANLPESAVVDSALIASDTRVVVVTVSDEDAGFGRERCASGEVEDVNAPLGLPYEDYEEHSDFGPYRVVERILLERGDRRYELDARCLGFTEGGDVADAPEIAAGRFRIAPEDPDLVYTTASTGFEGDKWWEVLVVWRLAPDGAERIYIGETADPWRGVGLADFIEGRYEPDPAGRLDLPPLGAPPSAEPSDDPFCREISELNTVYFNGAGTSLTEEARAALDENIEVLQDCPATCIFIQGQSIRQEHEGMDRATQRAAVVRDYYVDRGVHPGRIKASAAVLGDREMSRTGYEPSTSNFRTDTDVADCAD